MNLNVFQKQARRTAVYPNVGNNMLYPVLGLLGECGEICEKVKKLERDDNGIMTDQRREAIAKELGDAMWYISSICSEIGAELDMVYAMRGFRAANHTGGFDLSRVTLHLMFCATEVAKAIESWYYHHNSAIHQHPYYMDTTSQMSYVIHCITEIARQVCNMSIEEICAANMKKLLDRKSRGTLLGEGDNR